MLKTTLNAGSPTKTTESRPMSSKENITKLKKMEGLGPEVMKAFWVFEKAAVANGAIPLKYKESMKPQRLYCIVIHNGNARRTGATDAKLAEAAIVAAALGAGAAVTTGYAPSVELN
jgi:hypothetical protein